LVAAPLAAAKNAPLLLTVGTSLPAVSKTELQRVLPTGGKVYILGGTGAVPATVASELTDLGYQVVRYGGADRFATAVQVADALGDPSTVLLATGTNFPDALSAGVAAAKAGGTVLLTNAATLPSATSSYLAAHGKTVYAIGGPAARPTATQRGSSALIGMPRRLPSRRSSSQGRAVWASPVGWRSQMRAPVGRCSHTPACRWFCPPQAVCQPRRCLLQQREEQRRLGIPLWWKRALAVAVQTAVGNALGL